MGGLHTSTKKLTKQNTVTLGIFLVIWGPPWEPVWPWVCSIPILDRDEVGKSKKPLYIGIFLWEGCT